MPLISLTYMRVPLISLTRMRVPLIPLTQRYHSAASQSWFSTNESTHDLQNDVFIKGGYGVAATSRIDKIVGLFCKRAL